MDSCPDGCEMGITHQRMRMSGQVLEQLRGVTPGTVITKVDVDR